MPEDTPADPAGAPRREKPGLEREVDQAVEQLGRVTAGLVGHLFGAKAIGKESADDVPSLTPGVDHALDAVGDTLGKVLHAVGEGIGQLPVDAEAAVKKVGDELRNPAPAPKSPGWSGLSSGLGDLARGLGAAAERVAETLSAARTNQQEPPPTEVPPAEAEPAAPDAPEYAVETRPEQ
jgi:hypothetical protein